MLAPLGVSGGYDGDSFEAESVGCCAHGSS